MNAYETWPLSVQKKFQDWLSLGSSDLYSSKDFDRFYDFIYAYSEVFSGKDSPVVISRFVDAVVNISGRSNTKASRDHLSNFAYLWFDYMKYMKNPDYSLRHQMSKNHFKDFIHFANRKRESIGL